MKKRVLLLIFTLFTIVILIIPSCTKALDKEDLYGVWQGKRQETSFLFTFNDNGTCLLSFTDNISGETDVLNGTYETDFSKYPARLSINNISQLSHGLYTIIRFTDNNSLIIADFAPRWRLCPVSFENDTIMSLKRI